MPDQDGYEYWEINDPTHPYPVGDINVGTSDETSARADCKIRFPSAIPFDKSVAARSVGIARSWKFSFAVRSKKGAGGKIDSHILCTAKHVTWFEDHGEKGPGGVQTFQVDQANINNKREPIVKDIAHGPQHFDRVTHWHMLLADGSVYLQFLGWHQIWGKIGEEDKPAVTPDPGTAPAVEPGSGTLPAPPDKPPRQGTLPTPDGGSQEAPPKPPRDKPKPDLKP